MLTKTTVAFQDLVDYRKGDDGSWKAEFHGALDIATEGSTLEQCRRRALDELDMKLSAWIVGSANPATQKPGDQ